MPGAGRTQRSATVHTLPRFGFHRCVGLPHGHSPSPPWKVPSEMRVMHLLGCLDLLCAMIPTRRKETTTRRALSYIGHGICNSLEFLVTHWKSPKHHPLDFLQVRLSSQGLNTGSNPVGTTTPSLLGGSRLGWRSARAVRENFFAIAGASRLTHGRPPFLLRIASASNGAPSEEAVHRVSQKSSLADCPQPPPLP